MPGVLGAKARVRLRAGDPIAGRLLVGLARSCLVLLYELLEKRADYRVLLAGLVRWPIGQCCRAGKRQPKQNQS